MSRRLITRPHVSKWTILYPYRLLFAIAMLFIILQVTSTVLLARYLGQVMDMGLLADEEGFRKAFIPLLITWLLADVFLFFRYQVTRRTAENVAHDVRQQVVEHLSQVSLDGLERKHSGDYVSRLSNDLQAIKAMIANEWANLFRGVVAFVVALVILLVTSWKVTVLTLAFVPVLVLVASSLGKTMGRHLTGVQEEMAQLNSLAQDGTAGILVTKTFNMQRILSNRFSNVGHRVIDQGVQLAFVKAQLNASMNVLSIVPFLVLFGVGGYDVIQGRLSLGQLLMMLNLLNNLTWPLQSMNQSLAQIKAGLKASERIFEVLALPIERTGGDQLFVDPGAEFAIELDHVSFSYEGGKAVLSDLTLRIRPGEAVAIVGASGTGKSTLVSLLLGLRQPSCGTIRYYGQSIESLSLPFLRESIAFVPQETFLYPMSIAENIGYGKLSASGDDIRDATRRANAEDFISELVYGYDTRLGERGAGLSGGQKQRISLARAILRNTPILLLDEATSSLDTESEAKVHSGIMEVYQGRTRVVITHRLNTLQVMDRIILLDQGRVVEEGTHSELLARGDQYARLFRHSEGELAGLSAVGYGEV